MILASDAAFYVYAVLPADNPSLPDAAAILAGSVIGTVVEAGLAALVSRVPRGLFVADHPDSRAADPGWVAICAEAHHTVVQLAAEAGPCLPLGFGTLFASAETVRAWLATHAALMQRTLQALAGRQEWALTLTEDPACHAAWLEAHDADLRHLADITRAATPGTGFLLERRLARSLEQARTAHGASVAARLAERLRENRFLVRQEAAREGAAWSVLAHREGGFADCLATVSNGLFHGTGLSLRVTGPWPPYAFARAAWQEDLHAS